MIRALLASATRAFRPAAAEFDPFERWLAASTAPVRSLDRWTPAADLYADYEHFAASRDRRVMSRKVFAHRLRNACLEGPRLLARSLPHGESQFLRCWPRTLVSPARTDATITLVGSNLPRIASDDPQIWRRIRIIPWKSEGGQA